MRARVRARARETRSYSMPLRRTLRGARLRAVTGTCHSRASLDGRSRRQTARGTSFSWRFARRLLRVWLYCWFRCLSLVSLVAAIGVAAFCSSFPCRLVSAAAGASLPLVMRAAVAGVRAALSDAYALCRVLWLCVSAQLKRKALEPRPRAAEFGRAAGRDGASVAGLTCVTCEVSVCVAGGPALCVALLRRAAGVCGGIRIL